MVAAAEWITERRSVKKAIKSAQRVRLGMLTPPPQFRFKAVSMELVAHLDDHRVDMRVITSDGTTIAIECENDAILSVQRHISEISQECPEIATWNGPHIAGPRGSSPGSPSYEIAAAFNAAVSEGWPIERPPKAVSQ
jgi:hypothetical protein